MPETIQTNPTKRLTDRELEVLALIADGRSSKEVAQELWITEETVRTHVRRLLARLEARTRAQAVAIAFRDDLWARRGGSGVGESMVPPRAPAFADAHTRLRQASRRAEPGSG